MITSNGADRDNVVPVGTELVLAWRVRPGRECRVCREDRIAMMVKDKTKPDCHQTICRICANDLRALYEANHEYELARALAQHRANREREIARMRAWHEANREREIAS